MSRSNGGPPVLTEFVVGETSFLSKGYSEILLTRDGEEEPVRLPIRSIGVVELQEALKQNEPRPPEKAIVVKKDSPQGRDLMLEKDTPVIALDMADPEYRKAVEEFRKDFMWRTVVLALDVRFKGSDGNEITDPERIKEVLKASGITGHHLDQIILDVNRLTARREARADFLSASALG